MITSSLWAIAQLTPAEAGYIDAVADFGAKNDGLTVTTSQLQAAIDASISQRKGLYLPPGRYLIDSKLSVSIPEQTQDDDQMFMLQGSTLDPGNRSTIVLKAGTYTNSFQPGYMLRNEYYLDNQTTRTYNRGIQGINFEIEENNAGAIALSWRGAEGCTVFDVDINVSGGYAGIREIPASGGSMADITIIGGQYGIDLIGGNVSPTPVITHLKMQGQTKASIVTSWLRGALVLTGAEFIMNPGVPIIQAERHHSYTYHFGGCPLLSDCIVEYTEPDPRNKLMNFPVSDWDLSFQLTNVYVKNAAKIVDHDAVIEGNKSGWRHYRSLSYSSGTRVYPEGSFDDGIYIEGSKLGGNVLDIHTDDRRAPVNLTSIHGWGDSFPSFEFPGTINVKDFEAQLDNGDWSPAFKAAIEAANGNSEIVFVPAGNYAIYNTIELGMHTKMIGISLKHSTLYGWDKEGRRFGGSNDAFHDPRPMVQTIEDTRADNILADLGVRVVGPFNNIEHNPEPCVHYAILWRAGGSSIMRSLNTQDYRSNWHRAGYVLEKYLNQANWLSLGYIPADIIINGYEIYGDNASRFFNMPEVPSNFWLETVNGTQRLLTPSKSLFNNLPYEYKGPNISLSKTDAGTFTIKSLKLANGNWDPLGGDDISIVGLNGSDTLYKRSIQMKGIYKDRNSMDTVILNWNDLTKVVLTSSIMFSADDIELGDALIDFESLSGTKPAIGFSHQSSLYYDPARELPLSYLNHHHVKITGGVKWYNHRKHGDTWMLPTQAYLYIENNTAPVNIYHFHAQHSHNDQKLLLKGARDVSVWGVKTENAGYLARVYDSDNIRIFGHGGLTNPPPGASHYYFENTTNYLVSAPTDEVYSSNNCQYCENGRAILPRVKVGNYDAIQEIIGSDTLRPDRFDRPILWSRGNTRAAYLMQKDLLLPNVSIAFPLEGAQFQTDSTLEIIAVANSFGDKIQCLDLYIDGEYLASDSIAPFLFNYIPDGTSNVDLQVKAKNSSGFFAFSKKVGIQFVAEIDSASIIFLNPAQTDTINTGNTIDLSVSVNRSSEATDHVEYFSNGEYIGSSTALPYDLNLTFLDEGTFFLVAKAIDSSGNSVISDAVNIQVIDKEINLLPIISLSNPANPTSMDSGHSLYLSAETNDPDGQIVMVKFFANDIFIGSDTEAPFDLIWSNLQGGHYMLSALAFDDKEGSTNSDSVALTVLAPPKLNILNPLNDSVYLIGDSIMLSADASSATGTIENMYIYVGEKLVYTSSSAPYSFLYKCSEELFTYILFSVTDNYGKNTKDSVRIGVRKPHGPFNENPIAIPGLIRAVHFDEGGNGTAYFDDELREGDKAIFRPVETIDIYSNKNPETEADSLIIGSIRPGEWAEYAISILEAGNYDAKMQIASPRQAFETAGEKHQRGYFTLYLNETALDSILLNNTSDLIDGAEAFYTWETFSIEDISLPAGDYYLRWKSNGQFSLNTIEITIALPNAAPEIKLTSPHDTASYNEGNDILLSASASDSDGYISHVEFFADNYLLSNDLEIPFEFNWTDATPGEYAIFAIAYDNEEAFKHSDTSLISVEKETAIEILADAPQIKIYPNPYTSELHFKTYLPDIKELRISIWDASGKVLARYSKEMNFSESMTFTWIPGLENTAQFLILKLEGIDSENKCELLHRGILVKSSQIH